VLCLLPRERVMWPRPGQYDKPEPRKHALLGAPLDPLPPLMVKIPQGQVRVAAAGAVERCGGAGAWRQACAWCVSWDPDTPHTVRARTKPHRPRAGR
jgi:hypothetical protein